MKRWAVTDNNGAFLAFFRSARDAERWAAAVEGPVWLERREPDEWMPVRRLNTNPRRK